MIFKFNIWRLVELINMVIALFYLLLAGFVKPEEITDIYTIVTKNVVVAIYCHIQAKEFDER